MTTNAVTVNDISKSFRIYREKNQSLKAALLRRGRSKAYEDFHALQNIELEIPQGTTFGLMGHNGSGKSTLLKCMAGILTPDSGRIVVDGSMAAMLELGSGFHPDLSGRENVYLNGSILGMSRKEIDGKFDEMVDFAGVGEFIDQPVKTYSSGMYVRLGFSVAIHVEPDILLVDEILAVGDMEFQEKCKEKFSAFKRAGRTVVLVSHGLGDVRNLCDHAAWLDHGRLLDVGAAGTIVDKYTEAVHEAKPVASGGVRSGSGEIQVEKIELLDSTGKDRRTFRTGDAVTMRLHWTAGTPVQNPVFGVSLASKEGIHVWHHSAKLAQYVPKELSGSGSVDVVIDAVPLLPNVLDLSCSIANPDFSHHYDQWSRAIELTITRGFPRESSGFAALGSRWENLHPPTAMAATKTEES